jgi:glucosyl-dolichyl phosphate glucuronosyltransferase
MKTESVSVIIPTYKQKYLNDTLNSFTQQKNRNFEIIIVENGYRSDDTSFLVRKYQSELNIHWCFEPMAGTNRARNIGTQYANNDIIAITDDDVILAPTWIDTILKTHIEYLDVGIIGGKVKLRFLQGRPSWCIGNFARRLTELDWGDKVQGLTDWRYLVSANMSYQKRIFEAVGGFCEDPSLVGGNNTYNDEFTFTEIGKLHGKPGLLYVPNMLAIHQIPSTRATLAYMQKRSYSQGASDVALYKYRFPKWSQSDLLKMWEDQLYGQEWNYEEMVNDRKRLANHEAETFTEYFLSCRVFYLQGMGDMIRNKTDFSQFEKIR